MSKTYRLNTEESSTFLSPIEAQGEKDKKGERDNTNPLRGARLIDIERIKPDPNQPRKTFEKRTLESLAESIREIGEIIDPLTVAYDERENVFRIISGERRYRAATMVGLERLPCIIKEVDQKKTLLLQLITNLQREDITPLEESAGIRSLIGRFNYSQADVAKLLNKSQSYISQILGLERLSQPAREILQTSEVAKEVQIQASKEKDPGKQSEILKKASEEGKTVRQIRRDAQMALFTEDENLCDGTGAEERPDRIKGRNFRKWTWRPDDERFSITIHFSEEQSEGEKSQLVRAALEETLKSLGDAIKNHEETTR
ncbi:MAG: ParB/RepB/Spo0J family partition protein [Thermodesulfobacteriota bacterium]|jgi:ParB family chromosome partitioning protein